MPGIGNTVDPYDLLPDDLLLQLNSGFKPLYRTTRLFVTLLDVQGDQQTFGATIENLMDNSDPAFEGEWDALAEVIGELSNAFLLGWGYTRTFFTNKEQAFVYDEAFSTNAATANFLWQNKGNADDVIRIKFGAPDQSWFNDGVIDLENTKVAEFKTKVEDLIGNSYEFKKAYILDGGGREQRYLTANTSIDIQEPGEFDSPGEGPGNNPVVSAP